MWTMFYDTCSGGEIKEPPYELIFIESDENEAKGIFYARFGHNPERVTCTCCGDDYAISSEESFDEITKYHRETRYGSGEYVTTESFSARKDVLIIRDDEIRLDERDVDVPNEGYIWV